MARAYFVSRRAKCRKGMKKKRVRVKGRGYRHLCVSKRKRRR